MKLHEVTNQEQSILTVMGEQEDRFNGTFFCDSKELTSLEGAPSYVDGNFWCDYNKLTSLKGAPSHVSGCFGCQFNNLTSLEGAPSRVDDFFCYNNNLTSLEGAPSHISEVLDCKNNKLTSLKDIHKQIKFIGGEFDLERNPIKSHILGLLLIEGLNKVILDNRVCQNIINKHLGKGKRGMFDAQQELIEAGYPEMAQL